jgi:Protein of unknown function (DUF3592)
MTIRTAMAKLGSSKLGWLCPIVIGTAAAVLCLGNTHRLLEQRQLSRESRGWRMVRGEILGSGSVISSHPYPQGNSRRPTVDFRYVVDGRTYQGGRVSFRSGYDDDEAAEVTARYPTRSAVPIWYRPGDPGVSVLEPDSWDDLPALICFIVGDVFVIVATLFCAAALILISVPKRGR